MDPTNQATVNSLRSRADYRPPVSWFLAPFRRFARTASAGGLVLMAAAALALAWANSPWAGFYHRLWATPLALEVGGWSVNTTLHHLINDGLMAVFFFVVGLEIKREVLAGELRSLRTASLPMFAALGGMLVPAALYLVVNAEGPGAAGWGVPMATDIAFALGVLALLGDRVPTGLKVFLAALAIVDDIGAVLVIAVFYSGGVSWGPLAAAGLLLVLAAGANAAGVGRPWVYGAIGLALWGTVLASGVHATVAGVLLAMTIPVRTWLDESAFLGRAQLALAEFDAAAIITARDPDTTVLSNTRHHGAVEELEELCDRVQPPLIRLEHALQRAFEKFTRFAPWLAWERGEQRLADDIFATAHRCREVGVVHPDDRQRAIEHDVGVGRPREQRRKVDRRLVAHRFRRLKSG